MTITQRACRFTALLLLAAMALFCLPGRADAAGSFTDVSGSDWYYDAVNYVVGKGLFVGTSDTTFSPGVKISRAMFVTVLGRYANVDAASWLTGTVTGSGVNLRSGPDTSYDVVGSFQEGAAVTIQGRSGDWYKVTAGSISGYISGQYVSPGYLRFTDVGFDSYYAGYAAWAQAKGIVSGTGSDQFSPNANITREQMCAILNRFAKAMGLTLNETAGSVAFTDSAKISSWAAADVDAMQRCGVIQGSNTGAFNPGDSATRAEAAAVLQRFNNACGGFSPQTQQPDGYAPPADPGTVTAPEGDAPPVEEQPSAPEGDAPPAEEQPSAPEGDTPPAEEQPSAPDPGSLPDTPASLIGGTVGIQASVIRVGVLAKTGSFDTSVSAVTLQTVNGSGFEYGVMSGRQFASYGSVWDTTVRVTSDGAAFTLTDSAGNVIYTAYEPLALHPVSDGKAVTRVNDEYRYYGDFELRQADGGTGYINVINYVDIEDYVKGVVPYEFPNSFPAEALKAAAIACRSYAMSYDWGIYSSYGMDIVTGSGTQLYRGRAISYDEGYFAATDAAVDATSGQYLTYNGSICVASFSSCDGGQTLDAAAVFGTAHPYLTGKADPYEQAAAGDIAAAGGDYGSLVNASHKVGMSAWGAYAMAKYYGKSCESILGFYYTGASLQYGA